MIHKGQYLAVVGQTLQTGFHVPLATPPSALPALVVHACSVIWPEPELEQKYRPLRDEQVGSTLQLGHWGCSCARQRQAPAPA